MRSFPEIWCLNIWGCLKFGYYVPKQTALYWTTPNHNALNQTMGSQTKSCNTKLSSADKRENRAGYRSLTQCFFFSSFSFLFFPLPPLSTVWIFKRCMTCQTPALVLSQAKKNLTVRLKNKTWTKPKLQTIKTVITQTDQITDTTQKPEHKCLKYLTPLTPPLKKTVYLLHGFN